MRLYLFLVSFIHCIAVGMMRDPTSVHAQPSGQTIVSRQKYEQNLEKIHPEDIKYKNGLFLLQQDNSEKKEKGIRKLCEVAKNGHEMAKLILGEYYLDSVKNDDDALYYLNWCSHPQAQLRAAQLILNRNIRYAFWLAYKAASFKPLLTRCFDVEGKPILDSSTGRQLLVPTQEYYLHKDAIEFRNKLYKYWQPRVGTYSNMVSSSNNFKPSTQYSVQQQCGTIIKKKLPDDKQYKKEGIQAYKSGDYLGCLASFKKALDCTKRLRLVRSIDDKTNSQLADKKQETKRLELRLLLVDVYEKLGQKECLKTVLRELVGYAAWRDFVAKRLIKLMCKGTDEYNDLFVECMKNMPDHKSDGFMYQLWDNAEIMFGAYGVLQKIIDQRRTLREREWWQLLCALKKRKNDAIIQCIENITDIAIEKNSIEVIKRTQSILNTVAQNNMNIAVCLYQKLQKEGNTDKASEYLKYAVKLYMQRIEPEEYMLHPVSSNVRIKSKDNFIKYE